MKCFKICIVVILFMVGFIQWLEGQAAESGKRYKQLVIRNVIVIDGKGTPPRGPMDVLIEENKIQALRGAQTSADAYKDAERVIDGTGMYLLPGLINIHGHIHHQRGDMPIPFEYLYKLWLSCGITTVRDVGSNYDLTLEEREKSRKGLIAAPRIFLYMVAWESTPGAARKRVQEIKKLGGDGIKIFGVDRDIMAALLDEAHNVGLRVAHHVGVEETDARDDIAFGVSSVEHWYGVPDAALLGSQDFPPQYNYSNESDRFRYAGRLWREADPVKQENILQAMVDRNVAWCPTFVIYEANRDLQRAVNQPWFKEYLHPALAEYFKPNPANHGSYHWNWSTADEIYWKENYLIWMQAVRQFERMGGLTGVGEDAGYIYMLYGFSLLRELELQQEAGFHPIDVIRNATGSNAAILGMEDKLGRIRPGYFADFFLVDENPLENFKFLYPTGVMDIKDGKLIRRGGIKWTVKDGIVYHVPQLIKDIKQIVKEAR